MVSALTLLPDPDSPTTPRVLPGSTENDRPRTACTIPSDVGNETVRLSTASSGICGLIVMNEDARRICGGHLL